MAKKLNHRKKSVVNARVQWTLAMRVVIHFFLFICAGGVFGVINQILADPLGGLGNNLSKFWSNSGPVLLALICLIPIFIRDTLTLSNRIAGPIHNLKNTIGRLADGDADVPPLKFRKGDMWDDLPESFNRMVERLREDASADDSVSKTEVEHRELVEA